MEKDEKLKALAAVAESFGLTREEAAAYFSKTSAYSEGKKSANVVRPGMYYYSDGTISAEVLSEKQISGVVGWVDESGEHGLVLGLRETDLEWFDSIKWCTKYAYDGILSGEAFLPSKDCFVKIFKNLGAVQKALEKINQPRLKMDSWYWASTKDRYYDFHAWIVRPFDGAANYYSKGCFYKYAAYVRCVFTF